MNCLGEPSFLCMAFFIGAHKTTKSSHYDLDCSGNDRWNCKCKSWYPWRGMIKRIGQLKVTMRIISK